MNQVHLNLYYVISGPWYSKQTIDPPGHLQAACSTGIHSSTQQTDTGQTLVLNSCKHGRCGWYTIWCVLRMCSLPSPKPNSSLISSHCNLANLLYLYSLSWQMASHPPSHPNHKYATICESSLSLILHKKQDCNFPWFFFFSIFPNPLLKINLNPHNFLTGLF